MYTLGRLYTPPHQGVPPRGLRASGPPAGVSGAVPLKQKTNVNFPCKSIVISSQSGPFIRRMI